MSALPKAVRLQVDAANRLAEEMRVAREGAGPAEQPPVEAAPPAEAPPAPAAPAAPPAEVPDFEHRYKVLQGKYNAEVPRMQRQLQELMGRLEQQGQQLTATQGMLASFGQRGAAPAQPPAPPARLVKDEEIQTFGADLTDFIGRVAAEKLLPQIDARVQPVRQQVEEVRGTAQQQGRRVAEADKQRVLTMLDQDVPKWRELNEDATFLEWLAQVDPYAGRQRGELLREAYVSHDGPRVVAFFNGFLTEHATVAAPPAAAPAPAAQAQAGSQRPLDEFTAPGATKPAGTTSAPEGNKRIWTERDIKHFYDDCSAGKYLRNQKRRDDIERDIFAAQGEGRIRA